MNLFNLCLARRRKTEGQPTLKARAEMNLLNLCHARRRWTADQNENKQPFRLIYAGHYYDVGAAYSMYRIEV